MIRVYLFAYKAILYKKSLENKLIKLYFSVCVCVCVCPLPFFSATPEPFVLKLAVSLRYGVGMDLMDV